MEFSLGLALVIIVVAHLYALIQTLISDATGASKLGWTTGIMLVPAVGFLVWLVAGPRDDGQTAY